MTVRKTHVILSKRSASKDLRTDSTAAFPEVRRSFDSLRSLRMTNRGSHFVLCKKNMPQISRYS